MEQIRSVKMLMMRRQEVPRKISPIADGKAQVSLAASLLGWLRPEEN